MEQDDYDYLDERVEEEGQATGERPVELPDIFLDEENEEESLADVEKIRAGIDDQEESLKWVLQRSLRRKKNSCEMYATRPQVSRPSAARPIAKPPSIPANGCTPSPDLDRPLSATSLPLPSEILARTTSPCLLAPRSRAKRPTTIPFLGADPTLRARSRGVETVV
ncbi:hypothetical protein L211DRAFT_869457 [Terfezia boudieri ATCC MYA-4762]|uniref:Uncharacterized protein n=1 Tax=Terfezia boudieri ATCC MYA-4762 TaxID=1051890 RepID=A0A3N4LHR0_9PEZI|nr:hypothetical protein L211DRAFT_869457 [Terfezia boudieri ATCC MYA-4762]